MNATYAVRCYLSILLIAKFMDSRFWRLAVIAEKLNFLPICVNLIPRVSETRDTVHLMITVYYIYHGSVNIIFN